MQRLRSQGFRRVSNQAKCIDYRRGFGCHTSAFSQKSHRPAGPDHMPLASITKKSGFTLIELLVTVAILGVLAGIVSVAYNGYIKTTKISSAIQQIRAMSIVINDYQANNKAFPDSLADVDLDTLQDPWGHPYRYLNIATATNPGMVRKDHNLVPLNTDYDLYSTGPDGMSASPLTAAASQDDIVRANNGGYVGEASSY